MHQKRLKTIIAKIFEEKHFFVGVTEGSLAGFFTLQGIDLSLALTIVVFIRIFTRWIGVGLGFILLKMAGGTSSNNQK